MSLSREFTQIKTPKAVDPNVCPGPAAPSSETMLGTRALGALYIPLRQKPMSYQVIQGTRQEVEAGQEK